MFGLAVVAYLLAPILVHLLAGPRFHDSVHLFRALLPSLAGLTLAQLLVPQWISRGILGLHALVSIGMAVMMLVGTWYAIDLWGVKGAAYARVAIFGGVMVVTQLCFMLWIERRWRRTRSAT
jgi:O-antigen/teichoic acid export membrane protein